MSTPKISAAQQKVLNALAGADKAGLPVDRFPARTVNSLLRNGCLEEVDETLAWMLNAGDRVTITRLGLRALADAKYS